MKTYAEFKDAIGMVESSGNYQCVNKFGYLGKFQFGMARLCDLGVTSRRAPGSSHSAFEFNFPLSKDIFLSCPRIQDRCFDKHVQMLKKKIPKTIGDRFIDLSGAIAGCHLLSTTGLFSYFVQGIDMEDANGTKFSDYYHRFSGYQIP